MNSFVLYFVCMPILSACVTLLFLGIGLQFPKRTVDIQNVSWLLVAIVGPILEEGTFRLALVRNKAFMVISLTLLSFIILSCFCFNQQIYNTDHLLTRIAIALISGVALFSVFGKLMLKCKFKTYFWAWSVLFGCFHLMNFQWNDILPMGYVYIALYVGTKIIDGVVLGYARMRNSIGTSMAFHMLHNLISCFPLI